MEPMVQHDQKLIQAGMLPAKPFTQYPHILSIEIPIAKPVRPVGLGGPLVDTRFPFPVAALPGAKVLLTVYPISQHPERSELRRWVCLNPVCEGKSWTTEEELLRAHPSHDQLRKEALSLGLYRKDHATHVYYCVLEIPAEETADPATGQTTVIRPAQAWLLTPLEASSGTP